MALIYKRRKLYDIELYDCDGYSILVYKINGTMNDVDKWTFKYKNNLNGYIVDEREDVDGSLLLYMYDFNFINSYDGTLPIPKNLYDHLNHRIDVLKFKG